MPTTPSLDARLNDAARAIDASRPADALAPLVEAWRAVRAPELAELVAQVSGRVGPPAPLPGKTAKARHVAWLDLAAGRRAEDVARLLAVLLEGVKSTEAAARLEALEAFAPDPRIASTLTAIAARPPFQAQTTRPFWRRLYPLLVTHADPRTLEVLAPLVNGYVARIGAEAMGTMMRNQLVRALDKLRATFPHVPVLPPSAQAIVARMTATIPTPSAAPSAAARTEGDLLAAIAAAPDDDGPRLVYADWLMERGDPRGEFIALQFKRAAGSLAPEDEARETALLTAHRRAWLGPLHKAVKQDFSYARFRRGFLAEVRFAANAVTVEACVGDVRWTTVEWVQLHAAASEGALFAAPVFGALRTLVGAKSGAVVNLARSGAAPRLEALHCAELTRDDAEALPALTALRRLWVDSPHDVGGYTWMLRLPVLAQLDRLDVTVEQDDETRAALAALAAAADVRPSLGLRLPGFGGGAMGRAVLRFGRVTRGRSVNVLYGPEAHQPSFTRPFATMLGRIPADAFASVHVEGANADARAQLEPIVARFASARITWAPRTEPSEWDVA